MDLFLETFEVGQLVRDVEAIVQPLVEKNGNALVVAVPRRHRHDAGRPDQGPADAVQPALNAAKFTDHGTISLTVQREPTTGSRSPSRTPASG